MIPCPWWWTRVRPGFQVDAQATAFFKLPLWARAQGVVATQGCMFSWRWRSSWSNARGRWRGLPWRLFVVNGQGIGHEAAAAQVLPFAVGIHEAMPAASCPRCCKANRPRTGAPRLTPPAGWPMMPKTPHSSEVRAMARSCVGLPQLLRSGQPVEARDDGLPPWSARPMVRRRGARAFGGRLHSAVASLVRR